MLHVLLLQKVLLKHFLPKKYVAETVFAKKPLPK
jgi:hypothetical protein